MRVAENLFLSSAAFAITNEPRTTDQIFPLPALRARKSNSYKALVVLFMAGGADTFNLLMPHSNCDHNDVASQYLKTRGDAALRFGQMRTIQSFQANIGALVEPVTRQKVSN